MTEADSTANPSQNALCGANSMAEKPVLSRSSVTECEGVSELGGGADHRPSNGKTRWYKQTFDPAVAKHPERDAAFITGSSTPVEKISQIGISLMIQISATQVNSRTPGVSTHLAIEGNFGRCGSSLVLEPPRIRTSVI